MLLVVSVLSLRDDASQNLNFCCRDVPNSYINKGVNCDGKFYTNVKCIEKNQNVKALFVFQYVFFFFFFCGI